VCSTREFEELFSADSWQIARGQPDSEVEAWEIQSRHAYPPAVGGKPRPAPLDPVEAGFRAVAPDVARFHAYYMAAVAEGIAEFRRDFEARITKLETALAERTAPVANSRGRELIAKTIATLRAQLGEEAEVPSLEEEVELWKLVDFSIPDDEDD
jgi:hypothetical protein